MDIHEDISFGQQVFDQLENDFKRIIDELAGEQSLERFRIEYEKLQRALKNSYENEKKLLSKIKELNDDIIQHAAKLQMALKLTQDDTNTIQLLKNELEKAYKVLETSKDREEKSKQKIENLHTEIKHLTALNEQSNNPNMYKNDTAEHLAKLLQQMKQDRNQIQSELFQMKSELNNSVDKLRTIEQDTKKIQLKLEEENKQKKEINEKVTKDEERRKRMKTELEISQGTCEKEKKNKEILEAQLQEQVNISDRLELDKKQIEQEVTKIRGDLQQIVENKHYKKNIEIQLTNQKQQLGEEKCLLDNQIKKQEKYFNEIRSDVDQLSKQQNKLQSQYRQILNLYGNAEKDKKITIQSVIQLERQVMDAKSLNEQDQLFKEELKTAKTMLEKNLSKTDRISKEQAEKIMKLDVEIGLRETNIHDKTYELDQMKKQLIQLEIEKEKYGKQAAQANAEYFRRLEEIKLKDNLISEFQKKNQETEAKLKRQQTLYEAVRSAKNLYSKNLSETQDEIAEIKKRYKITNHQISQLKEEIDAKEIALAKEHFEHKKKDKAIEEFAHILEKNKKDIDQMQEEIKNYKGEINKLQFIIKESENRRAKLKEEYEVVVSERDILGTQLIRRNDESALLYEQIKIQQNTLAEGEKAYREREGDIELLEYKKNDLVRSLRVYKRQVSDIPELKNSIKNYRKELIEEQLKVKALSQELENPMNETRCRKLEGSDPDVFEMRAKLVTLQKRLISKTEQVVEKEVLVQQKEKQIQELREIMQRQPGPEEAKKLSSLQQSLKQRTRQMKSLAAELNMYQAQINEYKYDIEKITKDLQETKRKYHEQRKREQIQQEQNVQQV